MKIAYFLTNDLSTPTGVACKIADQVSCWEKENHEVKLFLLSPTKNVWVNLQPYIFCLIIAQKFQRILKSAEIFKIIKAWQPDLIYMRSLVYYPGFNDLAKSKPVFLEINSDDISEYRLTMPGYLYLYHLFARQQVLAHSCGIITVTNELAIRLSNCPKPFAVISNGIDLSRFEVMPPVKTRQPRLIFLSSADASWHGVDKVQWLAEYFSAWTFDVVGPLREGIKGRPPNNLTLHGFLQRSDYTSLIASADVAIGTLALHRKQMNEACPLKLREYLAFGLPAIIGYKDVDFPIPVPHILQIGNTPDNIIRNTQAIESFVSAWRGKRITHETISHIDIDIKERARLKFFQEVLNG